MDAAVWGTDCQRSPKSLPRPRQLKSTCGVFQTLRVHLLGLDQLSREMPQNTQSQLLGDDSFVSTAPWLRQCDMQAILIHCSTGLAHDGGSAETARGDGQVLWWTDHGPEGQRSWQWERLERDQRERQRQKGWVTRKVMEIYRDIQRDREGKGKDRDRADRKRGGETEGGDNSVYKKLYIHAELIAKM